ncbi:MAG: hypothetical protein ACK559_36825, partial [bacterium]
LLAQAQVCRPLTRLSGFETCKVGEVLPTNPLRELGSANQPWAPSRPPIKASRHASLSYATNQRGIQHSIATAKRQTLSDLPCPATALLIFTRGLANRPQS